MKYQSKKNNNTEEVINEEKEEKTEKDFDEDEYADEEFTSKKKGFFKKKKQEYEIIVDEDEEDTPVVEENKEEKKEIPVDEPTLRIEPIRTVTKEEYTDISKKRQEEKEKEEQEKPKKQKKPKKEKKPFKLNIRMVVNAIFLLILVLIIITVVDIVSVSKYNQGPYFAINTKTYKDGGTKVYYGIGYKVIKYNQLQGRKDMEIGTWSLKYNVEPVTISDIDLAIEFNNNEKETFDKYYKKFVRINSKLKKTNEDKKTITIGYDDEDGKYTMDIVCTMAQDEFDYKALEEGKDTTIIGTITNLKEKTSKTPTTLKVADCFAEQ